MKTKNQEAEQTARRDFLKMSAIGAAVTGTAMASGAASASEIQTVSGEGYRETEHVKTFYETARF